MAVKPLGQAGNEDSLQRTNCGSNMLTLRTIWSRNNNNFLKLIRSLDKFYGRTLYFYSSVERNNTKNKRE